MKGLQEGFAVVYFPPMIVNGETLRPHPTGALYWPDQKMLIVSDLHFEKASWFAGKGVFLPPYDTRATLQRLQKVLALFPVQSVLSLGDSFHDTRAEHRFPREDAALLQNLTAKFDWIWVLGNHDPKPSQRFPGKIVNSLRLGGLFFRHEPCTGTLPHQDAGEVAGHLHPKATVRLKGRRISRPCFISDGIRLVMPAFGAFTGGLDVTDKAFNPLFPGPYQAHLLGDDSIFMFSSRRLLPGRDTPKPVYSRSRLTGKLDIR